MLLMIDNYDSFTFNVYQYLGELGQQVEVFRNDEITLDEIGQLDPEMIVISPGPCTPNEAGISMQVVDTFGKVLLPEFASFSVYALMAAVLLWRPQGLFGKAA